MRQISRRMEIIHPKIGWRRDEHGTHKHAHGSWILWSVSRVRSKTMHSLSCITSWLPYITLCYIDSRFFLPLEQSRTALFGLLPRARLLVRNHAYPTPPQMSNGRVNHLGGEGRNGFGTLVNVIHQQNGWRAFTMWSFSRLQFCISRLKIWR